jgi:hypothetical protein
MKKIVLLFVIGILLLPEVGTLATHVVPTKTIHKEKITTTVEVDHTTLRFNKENDLYLSAWLGEEYDYLMNPGQPMIPRLITTFELPFGATNIQVTAIPSEIKEFSVPKPLVPSPTPLPYTPRLDTIQRAHRDETVYTSNDLYPHDWISVHFGCGLNSKATHITHLTVNVFPLRYRPATGVVLVASSVEFTITYEPPEIDLFPQITTYDLVIIAPSTFSEELQRLVTHKNQVGIETILKTTEEIYEEFPGADKPEQLKYFIKHALETWNNSYVLLVGGLKTILYARPKDDTNHGATWWHLPVRYSNFQWDGDPSYNFTSGEPGYISDLYYADIYKEGGVFEDWDANGNGIYAEWAGNVRDELDLYPDVCLGRLACRNLHELRNVIDKIITYESSPAERSWFKRIIAVSGDGFLDQEDWNIQWDTTALPDGPYTIYAQSSNPSGTQGPVDEIHVTLDKTEETTITFNHDDHLKEELQEGYPAPPIAEIVSISNDNLLGNTDYTYTPTNAEAYCNDLYWWANISYIDGVLTIRGKSYDPQPYGNLTDVTIWIENEQGTTVFSDTREHTETYYEGEWIVGDHILRGRGGALTYLPSDFETNSVFTSNGKWYDQSDVIGEFSKGYGLAYFSGHGSPGWWGDHYPGIPGNRRYGQVAGLVVTQVSSYFPYFHFPLFPMRKLTNEEKLPVVCVGGCHNSMFSISLIPSLLNRFIQNYMFTYGTPVPECWSWYLVKLPSTGAIATMGNTGYGWGSEGDVCTIGTGDGWINTEFFRQYGEEQQHFLGMAYSQAISAYVTHHKTFELEYWRHDYGWDGIDEKTVEQWQLLGDPSLLMGGYS